MGYIGKILKINLDDGNYEEQKIPDGVYRKYLSGIGLASYYLSREMKPFCDPMGPDNILGFVSGICTGSGALFSGRWMAVCKSPLTGTWGDANCGGNFAPAIKKCGYDAIFITGKSDSPVYVYIGNHGITLESAEKLWGKDSVETEEILKEKHYLKKDPAVVCIGKAGENLSLISGICNDGGRIAARSGVGAVMGSKNLKALVLDGYRPVKTFDRKRVREHSKILGGKIRSQKDFMFPDIALKVFGKLDAKTKNTSVMDGMLTTSVMKKWGTTGSINLSLENGDAPVKNWKGSNRDFHGLKSLKISPGKIAKREESKYHCYSCPLGCGGICKIDDLGEYSRTHKPEYETLNSFGPLLLNDDLDSIFKINELLNRAGMDTISAAGTVAYAVECFEKGIITEKDMDGLILKWGDSKSIIELLEKMINREGIGDILADGSKKASQIIGKGSEKFAVHAGGQELPAHDGRHDPGYALHYSVEPTPGRHTIGSYQYYGSFQLWREVKSLPEAKAGTPKSGMYVASENNAIMSKACSEYKMLCDCAGLCLFGIMMGVQHLNTFEYLEAATGFGYSPQEYMEIGHRIQTLRQLFNIKQGIKPAEMIQAKRASGDPELEIGPNKNKKIHIEEMAKKYWEIMGWDENGTPKPETLEALGIEDISADEFGEEEVEEYEL